MVGAGGLASSAGLYLAACGVGTLGIADFDRVELSNLNRQVIHGTADIGSLKVDSAKSAVERINPNVQVIPFNMRLTSENVLNIISDFDIVMDAATTSIRSFCSMTHVFSRASRTFSAAP
jgi:molybdopterin/thiamine biosynthesis adenylyltransferase